MPFSRKTAWTLVGVGVLGFTLVMERGCRREERARQSAARRMEISRAEEREAERRREELAKERRRIESLHINWNKQKPSASRSQQRADEMDALVNDRIEELREDEW